jgi:hypothetical protein
MDEIVVGAPGKWGVPCQHPTALKTGALTNEPDMLMRELS